MLETLCWIENNVQKRENNNPYDTFAVPGKVMMKGKIGLIVVGHVPKEFSWYIWFSIGEGAKFEVEIHKEEPMDFSLVWGGLEIAIKISIKWDEPEKLSILVAKVKVLMTPKIFYKN